MVTVTKNSLSINIESDNPTKLLEDIKKALTCVTAVLVESDEYNYYADIPDSLATLIRLNGELNKNN